MIDLSELKIFGFVTDNKPSIELEDKVRLEFKPIPLPKKLFSFTEKPIVFPEVPTPAIAAISPVGFSSTVIFKTFVLALWPSKTSTSTFLKKLRDFISLIVLFFKISL